MKPKYIALIAPALLVAVWVSYHVLREKPLVYVEGKVEEFSVLPYEAASDKRAEDTMMQKEGDPNIPAQQWFVKVTVPDTGVTCELTRDDYMALEVGSRMEVAYYIPFYGETTCLGFRIPKK